MFFFFFQAEDGIRDLTVTGVQTCALPICRLCQRVDVALLEGDACGERVGPDVVERVVLVAGRREWRDATVDDEDRKSVGEGKRVDLGGCRIIKKKKKREK